MVRLVRTVLSLCTAFFAATATASAGPYVYLGANDAFNGSGHIYQFSSDMGLLSPLDPASVIQSTRAFHVAVTPDGTSLYGAGNGVITQWDISPTGTLTPKASPSIPAGANASAITISPDGKSLYATDFAGDDGADPSAGRVFQFDVGPDGLTPKTPASVPVFGPGYVIVSADSRSVYVDSWIARIAQFTAAADGTLSPKTPALVNSHSSSNSFVVSPDGRSMYSYGNGFAPDNDTSKPWPWPGYIEQFDIASDGRLSHKSPSFVRVPTGLGQGIALSPDGKGLYATSSMSNEISQYDVTSGGLLSLKSTPTATVPNPTGCCLVRIAFTPDGRAAYVTASGASVAQMAVNADGSLTARNEGGGAVLIGASNTYGGLAVTNGPRQPAVQVELAPADATGLVSSSHTLTARLTDATNAAVPSAVVLFRVTGATAARGTCTTESVGTCSWRYTGPDLPGADQITACADSNANGEVDAAEPCTTATQAWLLPATTPGQVTGAGQISNAANTDKVAFGFHVKSDSRGVKGAGTVVDPSTNTKIELADATTMTRSGSQTTVFGTALVDGTTMSYRLDVADNADPGAGADTFRLRTSSGFVVSGTLVRGNIQGH